MPYTPQHTNLPPIDPDVKVPAAIRAAALRANALHNELYIGDAQPKVEAPEKPAGEALAKGGAVTKPDEEPGYTGKSEGGQQASTPSPGGEDDNTTWEHKYKSLKPRFDKQDGVISQLNGRISQLERMLASSAQPSPAERRNPDLNFKPLDKDEREAYGEDFLDVAARAAAEKLSPELASLRQEVDQIRDQNSRDAQKNLYAFLTDNLPSWRQINRNPKFIAWCNLPDAYSGAIRMSMLKDAFERADAQRVLRFFNGFLSDEAATDPAFGSQPETPRTPPNGGTNGKVPLEQFAAPGRAKAPAGELPPEEKETISQAQIAQFYLNVQKGVYRGNPAEKDRLERMIFAAQADGRIV